MPGLGADFYVGNGHKHLYTSRGVCLLWARAEHKLLYPLVIDGGGVGNAFEKAFMYQGTTDDLALHRAARRSRGARVRRGQGDRDPHGLATQGCDYLASCGAARAAPEVTANMCNVELPCKGACPDGWATRSTAHDYYVPVYKWAGST